jgi:hypothetical protein
MQSVDSQVWRVGLGPLAGSKLAFPGSELGVPGSLFFAKWLVFNNSPGSFHLISRCRGAAACDWQESCRARRRVYGNGRVRRLRGNSGGNCG